MNNIELNHVTPQSITGGQTQTETRLFCN